MAQKLCEKNPSKLGQWESGIISNPIVSSSETSSDEGELNLVRSSLKHNEPDVTRDMYAKLCNKSKDAKLMNTKPKDVENRSTFKCELCPMLLQSLNELNVHYFVEHNVESSTITGIHTSTTPGEKIEEKENTHHFTTVDKYVIKEIDAGQEIDAI